MRPAWQPAADWPSDVRFLRPANQWATLAEGPGAVESKCLERNSARKTQKREK